jgi:hypothetical protein
MAAPSAVFTIARVAEMLDEDVDWLLDVNDEGTTAFTSFGIENLKELIEFHKANPSIIDGYRKRA